MVNIPFFTTGFVQVRWLFGIAQPSTVAQKMDGWKTSFVLVWLIFRGERLVSGRVGLENQTLICLKGVYMFQCIIGLVPVFQFLECIDVMRSTDALTWHSNGEDYDIGIGLLSCQMSTKKRATHTHLKWIGHGSVLNLKILTSVPQRES